MKERTENIKFKFYSKCLFVILSLVLAIFLAGCGGGLITPSTDEAEIKVDISAVVKSIVDTDNPDYSPGDYVLVTGSGWLPGETVKLDFLETLSDPIFQQTITYYTVADSEGKISDIQYPIELRHLGATFILTATGQTSGLIATTTFTDADTFTVVFYVSPSGDGSTTPSGTQAITKKSTIDITATASSGHAFSSWTNAGGGITIANPSSASTTAYIGSTGSITANFVVASDTTSPVVTINQAVGQADPTNTSPINFTVVLSESVSDFATGDVTLSGTAGATTATVTGSGTTYNVAVSGMTGDGTVIATIAAGVAHDAAGNHNTASTSTDNQVTYDTTPPTVTVDIPAFVNIANVAAVPLTITSNESGTYSYTISGVATTVTGTGAIVGGVSVSLSVNFTTLTDGAITADASVIDAAGNTGNAPQDTATKDTAAPTITAPAAVTAEATGTLTTVSLGSPTVSDAVDPNPVVTNNAPLAGFPLGTTTVIWTATDASGNSATDTQDVTVVDTTPPTITAPADVTAEATSPSGAVVSYTVTATDLVDGTVAVTCAPVSGSTFALGETTVTCTAADAAGNIGSASFTITVQDTTPPSITVASSMSTIVRAPKSILPTPTVTDIVDPSPTVTNDAPNFFPPGITTVTWTATDASGNSATATTTVTTLYNFGGILQPINADGSSIFKLKSTIPVKFQLTDYNGNFVTTAVATIKVAKVSNGIAGDELEAISTSAATTGNLFRLADSQYIFNLATKSLSTGT